MISIPRPMHNNACSALPFSLTKLRCEGLVNPLGLDETAPRFSWQLAVADGHRAIAQSACQLQVSTTAFESAPDIWDSGKIERSRSFDLPFSGAPLEPRRRYFWRVRVWLQDGAVSEWSAVEWFETGLLSEGWNGARFIGVKRGIESDAPPAVYLEREFECGKIENARLYISALGIFDCTLNGRPVGEDFLAPGWTDFRHRLDYLVYDIGALLQPGTNRLRVTLGDGWWSGYLSEPQFKLRYGIDPALLAQLILRSADGSERRIVTDENWWATSHGPVSENALYHGETFDARIEPEFVAPADVFEFPSGLQIEAKHCPPIRAMERRAPHAITEPTPGVRIFDFEENIVGWARLYVTANAGCEVRLRFGEMLNADGSLYTENLRSARATDRYFCKGEKEETWEPRLTFHGFRYVELSTSEPAEAVALEAVILHSALAETGRFECSDPLINSLQRCIVRGQKGNFLDLPTDCPQRDERLGWSGDAQVFAPTACFNMESGALFRSWMRSMRDGQRADGALPDLAPHIILEHGNAGWGDAGILVPWTVWQFSGDTRILAENYASMQRHMEFMKSTSRSLIRPDTLFGDWLAVDAAQPQYGPTPKDLIGTAYFAHCARRLGEIAVALGKTGDAEKYEALFGEIREAFESEFITPNGRVLGDTQTSYLLALGFDLMPEALQPAAVVRLVELIRSRDWHLTTGFLGTPLLAPVLSACGQTEVAYRLLKQETYPGWLYPVLQGATTMWERWNSWTHEKGFGDVGMNSFNHYAYGAIGQWLYSTVAGVSPLAPGFEKILIRPEPGGGLSWARAEIDSPLGTVRVSWEKTESAFDLHVSIPPNATAQIHLPEGDAFRENGRALENGGGIPGIEAVSENSTVVRIGSGTYHFQVALRSPQSPRSSQPPQFP